jgi:hypothetical protein
MNKMTCGECAFFDPARRIVQGQVQLKAFGHCAKKSLYPFKDQDGQVVPAGAARVAEGELARPVIVDRDKIVPECLVARRKGQ